MTILDKSNSNKKDDEVYQCVRTALVHLNEFAAEEDNSVETNSNSIGRFLLFFVKSFICFMERNDFSFYLIFSKYF